MKANCPKIVLSKFEVILSFETGQYFFHSFIYHGIGTKGFQGIGFSISDPLKNFTLQIQNFFIFLDVQFLLSIRKMTSVFGIHKNIRFRSKISFEEVYGHTVTDFDTIRPVLYHLRNVFMFCNYFIS